MTDEKLSDGCQDKKRHIPGRMGNNIMKLRAWKCPECKNDCKNLIITPASIHGIGCSCGKMLRTDCERTRRLVEIDCREKSVVYNRPIEYFRDKNIFVVPKQFEISNTTLLRLLVENAIEYEFKGEL